MSNIRWGIIGTGGISHQMAEDFALVADAEVAAVCSRSIEQAESFAERHGIRLRYASREALFAADIDAVYIGTPHVTHFEIAAEAIRAGKHVLCEKPIGLNAGEVRELSMLAQAAGVFLMEGMWMSFSPLHRRLLELVNEGALGELRGVRAAFGGAFPKDGSSRWKPGGSTLLDQGIYPVTLAHALLGAPQRISAGGTMREDGVDLRGWYTLEYPGDRVAQGTYSMMEWIDSSAAVSGEEAWVTFGAGFWFTDRMTLHRPLGRGKSHDEVISVEREGWGYTPMLRAATAAIGDGLLEHPLHSAAHTLATFETMDEIRRQVAAR